MSPKTVPYTDFLQPVCTAEIIPYQLRATQGAVCTIFMMGLWYDPIRDRHADHLTTRRGPIIYKSQF